MKEDDGRGVFAPGLGPGARLALLARQPPAGLLTRWANKLAPLDGLVREADAEGPIALGEGFLPLVGRLGARHAEPGKAGVALTPLMRVARPVAGHAADGFPDV